MPLTRQIHELLANTRIEARKEVVKLFLEEQCGTGKGVLTSKYEYTVEKYQVYAILLKRPAFLNKGFDFTVHIKGLFFKTKRRHANPSHSDIIHVLQQVKSSISEEKYNLVKTAIRNIYILKEFDKMSVEDISFIDGDKQNRPIIILLLAIKWLFIEQDVTYWNWSGREMLMNDLKNNDLI